MRVRFTPEARLSVREKRAWWEQHREKAPRLFVEELAAIVTKLRDGAAAIGTIDAVRARDSVIDDGVIKTAPTRERSTCRRHRTRSTEVTLVLANDQLVRARTNDAGAAIEQVP